MKFGGASVGDALGILHVAEIVRQVRDEQPLVVVSALAQVTNLLHELAVQAAAGHVDLEPIQRRHREVIADLELELPELAPLFDELTELAHGIRLVGECAPRARDHLVSFGERFAARIVAAALRRRGIDAVAVDAWDLGMLTDGNHGRARLLPDGGRIRRALEKLRGVPVVTGYIAKDEQGNITTLGRNGSDYSAAFVAAAVGAREVQIWKDVEGVCSADPRLVPEARPLEAMSIDDMAELASFGSKVLHPGALLPAVAGNVPVRVLSHHQTGQGTVITANGVQRQAGDVLAIADQRDMALVRVTALGPVPQREFLANTFRVIGEARVDVATLATSVGMLQFAAPRAVAAGLPEVLRACGEVQVETGLALVGLVGIGNAVLSGTAGRALAALRVAGVEVRFANQGARANTLVCLVPDAQCPRAVQALHAEYFGGGR